MTIDERIQRFPQRGWRIEIGCPFTHLAEGEPCPITFKATHMRDYSTGDVEEFEALDLDSAVMWLEQRLLK